MRRTPWASLFALAALATIGSVRPTEAAIIVNDNFDTYANQAAFDAAWTPIGTVAPISGALSTAQASSGPNSIHGPGFLPSDPGSGNGRSRNLRTFAATPTVKVGDRLVWSYDFFDTAPTGAPQRNYVNLQSNSAPATAPPGQLISMGLNNNQAAADSGGNRYMTRVLGYTHGTVDPNGGPNELAAAGTGSGQYVKWNDYGTAGVRAAGWNNLKMVLSTPGGAATAMQFYHNNVLAESISVANAPLTYDRILMGSGISNGGVQVYFDNMYLEHVERSFSVAQGINAILNGGNLNFGSVFMGDPDPTISLTLANNSSAPLNLANLFTNSAFSVVSAPASIASDSTGNIVLSMDTAMAANFTGLFTFDTTYGTDVASTATFTINLAGTVIPEPATMSLVGMALVGMIAAGRRK